MKDKDTTEHIYMTATRKLKVILSIHSSPMSEISDLPFFLFFPDHTLPLQKSV